jgi:hypothetical protein
MEGMESEGLNGEVQDEEEDEDPNSQLIPTPASPKPKKSKKAAALLEVEEEQPAEEEKRRDSTPVVEIQDSNAEVYDEDPSSQLIPPSSPPKPKNSKKPAKKAAALPEVEEEQPEEENSRDSRLVVEIQAGPSTFEDSVDMDADPDMSLTLDGQVDGAPKPTQLRQKNGRFGRKARAAAEMAQQEADAEIANMLNGAGPSESGEKVKRTRKSRKSKVDEEIVLESQATDYSIPPDDTPILPKSAKGKRKAKTPIVKPKTSATVNDGYARNDVAKQDASQPEENSQAYFIQASHQLRNDALSTAPQLDEDENGTSSRPSKKALGKRKAVDPITDTAKKSKRRRETEPAGRDLRQMGFSLHNGSRSHSKDGGSQYDSHEPLNGIDLEKTARSLYSQTVREESAKKVSTTPILPPGYDRSGRRYPTPHFTPINRAPQKLWEKRPEREPERSAEPERDASEPAEVEELEEVEGSARQSRSPVPESNERSKRKGKVSVEEPEGESSGRPSRSPIPDGISKWKQRLPVGDTQKSARESQSLAPTSSGKRKRRLPIYEGESSTANSKKTPGKPRKPSINLKTPKNAKTPRPSSTPKPTATPGRLPKDDVEAISDAIENYRDMHDMTDYEINAMVQESAAGEGKYLWKDVYHLVPNIPKQKILNTARRKFHNFEGRGSWTKEQDEELREFHEMYPGKWTKIGQVINRFPEDCRDRWRNYLVCGDKLRKDVWDKDEEDRLKTAVKESLDEIRDLQKHDKASREKPEETLINWALISEAMGNTRSRLQCANKWRLLKERQDSSDSEDEHLDAPVDANPWRAKQAEHASRAMSAPKKLEVLRAIQNSGAGREGKVPWPIVKQEANFDGKVLALKVLFRNLRKQIADNREMRFKDILEFLIARFEESAPDEPHEFAQTDPFPERKRRRKQERKKKPVSNGKVSGDEDDNGEGPSDRSKKRSGKISKYFSEDFVVEDPEDDELGNGKGPSTTSEPQSTSKLKLKPKPKQTLMVLLSQAPSVENTGSSHAAELKSKRNKSNSVREEEPVDEALGEPEETPIPSKRKKKSRSKSKESPADDEEENDEVEGARPKKRSRKSWSKSKEVSKFFLDEAAVGDAEVSEDGESSATKTRRKSKSKKTSSSSAEDDNKEHPELDEVSAPPKRRKSKSKTHSSEEQSTSNGDSSSSKNRKKKRHDRMKLLGESQSQETTIGNQSSTQDTNDELVTSLSLLKNGKDKKPKRDSDGAVESDEERPRPASNVDENDYEIDVDQDQDENIFDQEEPLDIHASDANADEMDLDQNQEDTYSELDSPRAENGYISEQEQEEIREYSPAVDPDVPTNDYARETARPSSAWDHDSEEDGVHHDLANGVGQEELDEDFEKRSLASSFDEANIESHLTNGVEEELQDEDFEKQSITSDSDEANMEPRLANSHEFYDDLEPPTITNDEDLDNPTPASNQEQSAQDLDDETSTSGPDTDSDSDSDDDEDDEDQDEDEHLITTNGFHRGSPSSDIQRDSPDRHSDREDSPTRGPSPDLDIPKANDGRRRSLASPAKFGQWTGRRNDYSYSRSPSISTGSDSSIPARVYRRREFIPEGSVEL